MSDCCAWCQLSRFQGFKVLCSLSDELLEPTEPCCQEATPKDHKEKPEVEG